MDSALVDLIKFLQTKFPKDKELEALLNRPRGRKPVAVKLVHRDHDKDTIFHSCEEAAAYLKMSPLSLRSCLANTKGIWERPRSKTTIFWVSKIGEDHPALQADDQDDDFSMIPAKIRKNARNREELVFLREHEYGGKRNPFTKARKQA